jgi:threonine synthase
MLGYQAEGAAPFVHGHPIELPETIATAIRIGAPQSWDKAVTAQTDSGGWFDKLTDEEILAAQKDLSTLEGVFCEPASACSIAGALRDIETGKIPEGSRIVCTLTGNGLKDPDVAIGQCQSAPMMTVDAQLGAVEAAIVKHLPGA